MDIENSEWRVIPYLTEGSRLEGVQQLAIEIHTMNIINAPADKVSTHTHTHTRVTIFCQHMNSPT